ncbi:MAG TPA: hypothetical protein VLX92_04040 [Kofleriaceae bacterium]|nr:hypothetical protein [Kofleriaceae bacterium]
MSSTSATSERGHQHSQTGGQPGAAGQAAVDKPGIEEVKRVTGSGDPAATRVAQIIRAHREERDDIMAWLHQNRGNAFVQEVTHHMGVIEQALPPGVELKSVNASMTIPGGRKLGGGFWSGYSVKTKDPTQIYVEVSTTGIRVVVSPGLYLDIDWPGRDAELRGAGLDFTTGKPTVDVEDGGGIGVVPLRGMIEGKITTLISEAVAGTKLAGRYDPVEDPDLQGTLNKVMVGFTKLFAGHDGPGGGPKEKPPIATSEMTNMTAGGTLAVTAGGNFVKDGSGLVLSPGAPLTIGVDGAGDVGHIMAGKDLQAQIDAANIQAVHLSTPGMQVVVKGKPVAQLEALTLARGGKVTVDQMTPLGKLATAEAAESGLSLLVTLIGVASHDPAANDFYRNAQNPQIVDGVTRGMIEQQFTDNLHKLILQYRHAVPGVDIAQSLGIG